MSLLSDERYAQIDSELRAGGSISGIATRMGLDRDTVRKRKARLGGAPQPAPEPAPVIEWPDIAGEMDRLAKRRDLKQEKELLMSVTHEKGFRAFLENIMRDVAPAIPAIPALPSQPFRPEASHETMLLVLSDWHAFEEVSAARTMGFNEFSGPILCERIKRIVLSAISIKQRLERGGGWQFGGLDVACNGDFISGTIHELERHSDAANVVHAAYATGMLLAASLRDLASHFPCVRVHCTSGNHGRLPDARKVQQKDPTRSWDTFIYLYAMTALAGVKNVSFSIPDSYFEQYDIEGWRFLQTHGHDIKSWNSIPYYGIDRFGRNVQALHNSRSERIDYFVVSHFHSAGNVPAAGGETFINGSVIGGTEFSIAALGKSDKPSQWLFTVHQEHGVCSRWPILGNGAKRVEPYPLPKWPAVS